jgi:hypothetical protein
VAVTLTVATAATHPLSPPKRKPRRPWLLRISPPSSLALVCPCLPPSSTASPPGPTPTTPPNDATEPLSPPPPLTPLWTGMTVQS